MKAKTFAPSDTVRSEGGPFPVLERGSRVVVIGAGAFGGWSALFLQRQGFRVTLVDCWGAGNSRSSSGDETRVIRSGYGANRFYFDLNVRALALWQEHDRMFGTQVFFNKGVLWLCYDEHASLVEDSIPFAEAHGMQYEHLSRAELSRRYPVLRTDDLRDAYLDPFGGYLKAREACEQVRKLFLREGGEFIQAKADCAISEKRLRRIMLDNGPVTGDAFVFACGPWLPSLFPDVLADRITCTRQEVLYFGTPAGAARPYDDFPVWIDLDGDSFYYGIAGNAQRGFKIGVDKRGAPIDPTHDDRLSDPRVVGAARSFLAHRFPGLAGAPLIESRVCSYESTSTGNFIFDVHPACENVYLLGGGSGHGFKHGPALGERVAAALAGVAPVPAVFRL